MKDTDTGIQGPEPSRSELQSRTDVDPAGGRGTAEAQGRDPSWLEEDIGSTAGTATGIPDHGSSHSDGTDGGSRTLVLVGGGHANLLVIQGLRERYPSPIDLPIHLITRDPKSAYSGMLPGHVAREYRWVGPEAFPCVPISLCVFSLSACACMYT